MSVRNLGCLQDFDLNTEVNSRDMYKEHWERYGLWEENTPIFLKQ